jgi:hypothetical protein
MGRISEAIIDDELVDGDEISLSVNSIYDHYEHNAEQFISPCGFSSPDFCQLCDPLTECLEMRRRGRHQTIDSFLLFLRWLCSGHSVESIAVVFGFSKSTLHPRVLELLEGAHDLLIGRLFTAQGRDSLLRDDESLMWGFSSTRRSGAAPKCQAVLLREAQMRLPEVITNRDDLTVHGTMQDFRCSWKTWSGSRNSSQTTLVNPPTRDTSGTCGQLP